MQARLPLLRRVWDDLLEQEDLAISERELERESAAAAIPGERFRPDAMSSASEAVILRMQRGAGNAAVAGWLKNQPREAVLARHPLEKVLKFSAKWLTKRTVKTVSKHIARHGRNIAGRAIHTVFKYPKKIRDMLELSVRETGELIAKHAKTPADQIIQEAGLRIVRQASPSGKVRWLVTREFKDAIGTGGERFLAFVIDMSGRIVTAFPSQSAVPGLVLGLTAGATTLLFDRTAEAAENIRSDAEQKAKAAAEKEGSIEWQELIPIIGDIWGGSLNEGEDEYLRQQRFYQAVVNDVILEVEHEEQRTLGPDQRAELENLIRASIAAPYLIDEAEAEAP